jgi:chemotaxis protein methyltransferase CheR
MSSEFLFFQGRQAAPRVRRPRMTPPASGRAPVSVDEPCERLFRAIFACSELRLEPYRQSAMVRRTAACLRFLKAKDVAEAVWKVERDATLARAALNVVLLGVTEFFRDAAVFTFLLEKVLPAWPRGGPRRRIWSAACSEGHELYSVALALAESGRLAEVELVGTDCREEALVAAGEGRFSAETIAKLEPRWRPYFAGERGAARIAEGLRRAVQWRCADLLRGPEPGPWDVILWRNMAIYLEPEPAGAVWRAIIDELAPGGYLITGKADHPPAGLPITRVAPSIYRKRVDS